jgi:hypothetical protein
MRSARSKKWHAYKPVKAYEQALQRLKRTDPDFAFELACCGPKVIRERYGIEDLDVRLDWVRLSKSALNPAKQSGQTFNVPQGVGQVHLTMFGAGGGGAGGGAGGNAFVSGGGVAIGGAGGAGYGGGGGGAGGHVLNVPITIGKPKP